MNISFAIFLIALVGSFSVLARGNEFTKGHSNELATDLQKQEKRGLTGWEAFSNLQNGNMRFYEGRAIHPNQSLDRKDALTSGQTPHTIVLSCSDSRVPPELIFDQGLGEVFVVRVAGNVVNTDGIASIEYALEHLGAKLIVVMGHESCGAVGAAVNYQKGISAGSASLDELVEKIKGGLSTSAQAHAKQDKSFREAVKENVDGNAMELLRKSDIIREKVRRKEIVIAHAIYSLKSGRVEFWDVGQMAQASTLEEEISGPRFAEEKIETSEPVKKKVQKVKPASFEASEATEVKN